jgi:hypothetical protein
VVRGLAPILIAILPAAALGGVLQSFEVEAAFEPSKADHGEAAVAVRFHPLDPDLRVNEKPTPRLELDLTQTVLVDRQGPPKHQTHDYDPLTATYLDLEKPVRFPVALAPGVSHGTHEVAGRVVFFYCSLREAWCRRGTADVQFTVAVP